MITREELQNFLSEDDIIVLEVVGIRNGYLKYRWKFDVEDSPIYIGVIPIDKLKELENE